MHKFVMDSNLATRVTVIGFYRISVWVLPAAIINERVGVWVYRRARGVRI